MKAYPLLLRNQLFILVLLSAFMTVSFVFADQENKAGSFESKMKRKNFKQWVDFYFPYFRPTQAQLHEEWKKDPKWGPIFEDMENSSSVGGKVQTMDIPGLPLPPESNGKEAKKQGLPKGSYMVVPIPEGVTVPPSSNTVGQPVVQQDQPQLQPPLEENTNSMLPVPMGIVNENLIQPPTPEKSYTGIWSGQYDKLIEYFDQASQSWKASENSLKDVPVELNFSPNGQLAYKMPEREGSASFSVRNGYLSIICPDVRVRGDYEVFQKDSTLLLRTSRVLVKDKMRVSLEFKLAQKV